MNRKHRQRTDPAKRATAVLPVGFLTLILLGALLLMLPVSSASGEMTSFHDALFTATSATCVTGLITLDTAAHWSTFGHSVILCLIQVGGLGFMAIAVMVSLVIKRAISPRERMIAMQSYGMNTYERPTELIKRITLWTFSAELVGAVALSFRFVPDFGWREGIFKSVFHAVSAFCNAGFDTVGRGNAAITSLSHYSEDVLVNVTLMLLIALGGIGFLVISEIFGFFARRRRVSAYSKMVLIVTGILIFVGAAGYAVCEWNNPQTLGGRGLGQKLLASFFQSVTLRTAGFAMIDNTLTTEGSKLLALLLMFIGGASGSTAGGVKVVTFGILVWTVFCVAIGRKQATVFGRKITSDSFTRAASIVVIQLGLAILAILALAASMNIDAMTAAFEVVSAGGTVGLSLGLTPSLNLFCKYIVMLLMFFGRVGILSITYTITFNVRDSRSAVEYPDANLLIG